MSLILVACITSFIFGVLTGIFVISLCQASKDCDERIGENNDWE